MWLPIVCLSIPNDLVLVVHHSQNLEILDFNIFKIMLDLGNKLQWYE